MIRTHRQPMVALAVVVVALSSTASLAAETREPAVAALVVLDFTFAPPVTENTTRMIESLTLVELTEHRALNVLSSADVRGMLDHEASRQTFGCSEESSCLAAVTAQLGARYVVTGEVTRLDRQLQLSLVLLDAEESRAVSRESALARSFQGLTALLPALVGNLVAPLTGAVTTPIEKPLLGRRMADPESVRAAVLTGAATAGTLAVVTGVPLLLAAALMPFAGDQEFEAVLFPVMVPFPVIASAVGFGAAMVASTVADLLYGQWSIGRMLTSGVVAWILGIAIGTSSMLPVIVSVMVAYTVALNFFPTIDPVTDPTFLVVQSLLAGGGVLLHALAGALFIGAATGGVYIGGIGLFAEDDALGDDDDGSE
jgi:TolB-like protein